MNKKPMFDFIVGNPPYQEMDGGAAASARPIYHHFFNAAKDMATSVELVMPARWMAGGKGLDGFRKDMLQDKSVKLLHDYTSSAELFNNVDIKGGVCVLLWDKNHNAPCTCIRHDIDGVTQDVRYLSDGSDEVFIRYGELVSILHKVQSFGEDSVSRIVSPTKPYGLRGDTMRDTQKYNLPPFSNTPIPDGYEILGVDEKNNRIWKYIHKKYPLPKLGYLGFWKVFIPEAYGCGALGEVPSTPVLGTPVQICTETFVEAGPFETQAEAENFNKYLHSKFFRCLVSIKKQTQHAAQRVYEFVPVQVFDSASTIDWSQSVADIDKQLYTKYGLSQDEIDFIESHVKEME